MGEGEKEEQIIYKINKKIGERVREEKLRDEDEKEEKERERRRNEDEEEEAVNWRDGG